MLLIKKISLQNLLNSLFYFPFLSILLSQAIMLLFKIIILIIILLLHNHKQELESLCFKQIENLSEN
jgi:hypothetical protein